MKTLSRQFIVFIFGIFFLTSVFASGVSNPSLAPMLQKVLPAIVNIRAQIKVDLSTLSRLDRRGNNTPQAIPNKILSGGSGVIVDAQRGYIFTNAHVIQDAQTITATLNDGRHFTAKVIGIDKPSDIAVLQIQAKNLSAVPIGDSNLLKVGDFVATIGTPFGLNQTVTSGIVSALGRATLGLEGYENFIQTDAPINPGNSGGALVDVNGHLIGINTAVVSPTFGTGIGFAIPSNMAKSVMMQLIEFGNVRRGMIGVGAQDISPDLGTALNLKTNEGAVVTLIVPNSPAEKAGIMVGDIITKINNFAVKNANDVVNAIGFLRVNSKASIDALRANKPIHFAVDLMDPEKRKLSNQTINPFLYGAGLKNFSVLSPLFGAVKGVLVVGVEEDSNAWQANLLEGDVITSANQQRVTNIEELKKAMDLNKKTLLLNVLRGGGAIFLVINKES